MPTANHYTRVQTTEANPEKSGLTNQELTVKG